jgi:phage-related protein
MAVNSYSLLFNGTSRRGLVDSRATIKGMSAFTWMAWVKPDPGNNQYKRLYVERQGTGSGIRFACTPMDGKLRFEFTPKDGAQDTNYDYKFNWDDYWHHVAFVARLAADGSTYQMYLDAVLVAEGSLVVPSNVDLSGSTPIVSNTTPLGGSNYLGQASFHTSGSNVFDPTRYWAGKVDEMILFNAAKAQGDIQTYFTSDDVWDMTDVEMFSYWRFDEGSTNTSADADNPAWTTIFSTSGIWEQDRPFLGNGVIDTVAPTVPATPATDPLGTSPDGFTATWGASTDQAPAGHNPVYVQYYELQVSTTSDFSATITTINNGRNFSRHVNGLLPTTNYYWRVRAVDAESNASGWTATQSVTTTSEGDVVAPNSPTNLTAPSLNLSYTSFRVSWTASTSGDVSGYKIDVSESSSFNSYVTGYRNLDIGSVTQYDISGVKPLTTYYVRVRAYDTSDNDSDASATLVVTTLAMPDVTPPLPVEMLPPTSVSGKAATLNWEEGIDDIGVSYYRLDVAYDELFAQPATLNGVLYTNVNVGNVTSFRLDGLSPETTYFYRVRAYDGAGNMGPNPLESMPFTSEPTSLNEGGNITTYFGPADDAWINSAATSQNNGTATTLSVLGSGSANTQAALLRFDLGSVVGSITNVTLRLYVTDASTAPVTITVDNVTFEEETVTWANAPAMTSGILTFTPLTVGTWVDVDITSLILDGPTTYTVKLAMTSSNGAAFSSKEGTDPPQLVVESDPSTMTEADPDITFTALDGTIVNYIKNPSFESGTTTSWTAIGTTPATLSVLNNDSVGGSSCLQVTCSGQTGQGARYAINDIPAAISQNWGGVLYLKSVSGGTSIIIRVSEYTSGGVLNASSTKTVTISTARWTRFDISRLLSNASTAFVTIGVETPNATAATFKLDNVLLTRNLYHTADTLVYFDGNTSRAFWQGTANASRSQLNSATIQMQTDYEGDGDLDNSIAPFFRRAQDGDDRWFYFPQLQSSQYTNNRGIKRVTSYFGPAYGVYNYIANPSFELGVAKWTKSGTNGTIVQDTEKFYNANAYDQGSASLRLDYTAGGNIGIISDMFPSAPNELVNLQASIWVPVGVFVTMVGVFYTSAGALVGNGPITLGVNRFSGINDWMQFTSPAFNAGATVALAAVSIYVEAPSGSGSIWIDTVQASKEGFANVGPYRDGSMLDAIWEGAPHASYTSIQLREDTQYVFKHRYYDPDGLVNVTGDGFYHLAEAFTTQQSPDNVTTLSTMDLTVANESIDVHIPYNGDDNGNMTASVTYKRTDLANWTNVIVSYDRVNRVVFATIPNLKAGTRYDVRAIFSDADGVYGGTGVGTNTLTATATTSTVYDSAETKSMITFGGFVLMGRDDGLIGVESHDAFGLPDRRLQIEDLPRVDGAIELQNLWGRRKINMTGFVTGMTRSELEDNKNALKRALAPKLQRLVIDTLANDRRYYTATCESLAIAEQGGETITHLKWDAVFTCADPFAYDAAQTIMPEFTATNGSTLSVINEGDLRVDPYFEIRTTSSKAVTLTIYNQTTGERITPDTTIINNDKLTIDTNTFAVTKNGVEVDYAGGFPHLAAGANTFQFFLVSSTASPSIKCKMTWRHRYL